MAVNLGEEADWRIRTDKAYKFVDSLKTPRLEVLTMLLLDEAGRGGVAFGFFGKWHLSVWGARSIAPATSIGLF